MERLLKYNYQDFMIFFTFFLIWLSVQFGEIVEDSIAYILVVSVGILHGANDLLILSKMEDGKSSFIRNLLIYIGIIALCALIYFLNPFVAIVLFILLSAYHFGEEHFGENLHQGPVFDFLFFTSYGLLLFSLLFYLSQDDVAVIMNQLAGKTFTETQILATLFSTGILVFGLAGYVILAKKETSVNFGRELFYLLVLLVVFNTSSLVLSFAIYFIFWHSIPSIIHQTKFISGDIDNNALLFYVKKAAVFWGISIVGLVVLYFLFPKATDLASVVFAILFAVTAPHTWVMYQMKN
ncbi:MAG: Brp/Blh family beta-carotene 15,15'-dioxygenase [Polaribacter sp.]|jgi:Brp/Blh family beta-carotene 15,15'-monooxygenase